MSQYQKLDIGQNQKILFGGFEVDYVRKAYEKELLEKDEETKALLAQKDEKIRILTAKLKENGIL